MDSLLDDQPDWLQVIDSCLCNRLTQYRLIIMIKAWEGAGRGGGGYSTKFYAGKLRPKVQRLTLLYTIFGRKAIFFVYL